MAKGDIVIRYPVPMVDLKNYGFVIYPRYYVLGWTKDRRCCAQKVVAERLEEARDLLGPDHNFKIWSSHRTFREQKKMREYFTRLLMTEHPDWSFEKVMGNVDAYSITLEKFSNQTNLDCHRFGGAFDLTIVDSDGNELNMGTDHDDLTERANPEFFHEIPLTQRSYIDESIIENREKLQGTLIPFGFKQHRFEWYHWWLAELEPA